MLVLIAILLAMAGGLILFASWFVDVSLPISIAALVAIAVGALTVGALTVGVDAFVSARRARRPVGAALRESFKEAFEVIRSMVWS